MDEVVEKKAVAHAVPPTLAERKRLREIIAGLWAEASLTPPLSMSELSDLSLRLIREQGLDKALRGWLMVEINNCAWKEVVASVPYEKRILLLPQCLRHSTLCRAEVDELGLLCRRCDNCTIPNLQDQAYALGMLVLVAEGFTSVMGLIESGAVDTVIGVGCMDSLEKAFPLIVRHAVPGIAIPLNRAGCKDTQVDGSCVEEWMRISLPSPPSSSLLVHEEIKATVRDWFLPDRLTELLGEATDPASFVAREWLSGAGKRWRPYLLVCVYLSLTGQRGEIPEAVRRAAVAVECFHKASLVHDDIQDNDALRNNRQTVHAAHGVPIAINVGDILLGEGYRLLSSCERMELLQAAAEAHVALCKGQGMELHWSRSPGELTLDYVLGIFSHKTVPAFRVALEFGMICAGVTDATTRDTFHAYSHALGIAYQLLDDAADFANDAPLALRPSATIALLSEQNKANGWIRRMHEAGDIKAYLALEENKPLLRKTIEDVTTLAEAYHRQAIASLSALHSMEMKRLLFRLTERILKQ